MPYSSKVAYRDSRIHSIDGKTNVSHKAGFPFMVGRTSWMSIYYPNRPLKSLNTGGTTSRSKALGLRYTDR
tara:strand:- start:352 stop:564 length:213 start_codon:yes stop_codon:yes gene_type:complete